MGEVTNPNYAPMIWGALRDGGTWAVPRTGLAFRKDEGAKTLTLTDRAAWKEGMPCTEVELREAQDYDYAGIKDLFAAIGIEVTDEGRSI